MVLSDQPARERAATALDTAILVEASAGTGKTTTMVARLVHLLTHPAPGLDRPARLAEIVAITFTERAAQELKDRLRAELFRALAADPGGSDAPYLAQALAELEQAPIGTIHGLCARILRQYPIDAGIDVQFSIADERESAELRARAWDEWLSRELGREGATTVLERAFALGIAMRHIRAFAFALVRNRAWAVGNRLAEGTDRLIAWPAELAGLGDVLGAIERNDPSLGFKRRPDPRTVAKLRAWFGELNSLGDRDREAFLLRRLPFNVDAAATQPFIARLAPVRDALAARAVRMLALWLDRAASPQGTQADADGPGFPAEYVRRKEAQGVLDFDDLLVRARDLLRGNRSIRRDLQDEYRFLIVDEFQDTDPVQAELIVYLAQDLGDDASWTAARLAPGKLCVVGDPKQSIYRFRGADIETYSQVARLIGPDGACALRTNFRSHRRIIDAVNDVFGRPGVFRDPGEPGAGLAFRPVYQPLVERPGAFEGATEPVARVRWLVPAGEESPNLTEGRPIEARLVAAAIRRIVIEGWPVTDPETGGTRPAQFGDVAALYRKSTGLEIYERALAEAGVPFHQIGGRNFYQREEIVRLIAALSAIEQPSDALAVVAALRSPFFGVSDVDLARAALQAASRFDYRTEVDLRLPTSVREAFRTLRELHAMRRHARPSELVQALFDKTKALAVWAQAPNGDRIVANLLKVLDEARRLEREGAVPFRRLAEHLRALRDEGDDEGEAVWEDESGGRVHLLTIHKAKGLEFPVVIVIDLAAQRSNRQSDGATLLAIRTDPASDPEIGLRLDGDGIEVATEEWDRLAAADDEREEAESVRLLYVALTRARDYLLLPRVAKPRGGRSWQTLIEGAPESAAWDRWTPAPAPPPEPADRARSLVRPEELARDRAFLAEERDRLRTAGLRRRVRFVRPSLHEPERADAGEETAPAGVAIAAEGSERGRRIGTIVHAALERLRPGADEETVRASIEGQASEYRCGQEEIAVACALVLRGLGSAIVARAERAEHVWREVPVMFTVCADGETGVVRGVCDLVFAEGNGLVLVDYKTDRGTPERAGELVDRYRAQVRAYADGLTAATGRPVVEAWLVCLGIDERAHDVRVDLGD